MPSERQEGVIVWNRARQELLEVVSALPPTPLPTVTYWSWALLEGLICSVSIRWDP